MSRHRSTSARVSIHVLSATLLIAFIFAFTMMGSAGGRLRVQRDSSAEGLAARGPNATDRVSLATNPGTPGAPSRNAMNRDTLKWAFGGQQQCGWFLYVPLIQTVLGVSAGPDSNDFTQAVARWQQTRGLRPTGVIDEQSWSAMVRLFQSNRIKGRTYPTSEQLVEVPGSQFYDPQRPAELRRMERATYEAYKRMVAAALKDRSLGLAGNDGKLNTNEKFLKVISAFRSREYQNHLRSASPKATRAGLAVNSPHFTGRALDLYVGGEPVSTKDSNRLIQTGTPVYKWLVRHAREFGFQPYFYEPWHWEYVPEAVKSS